MRRGQPDPVETQAEMPLDQPAGRGRAKPTPDADDLHEARDAFDVHQGSTRHAEGTRRDLLPDIEEINSTLRATGDRAASEADASDVDTVDTALRRRRGTRLGFALSLMVAAALTWAYVNAGLLTDWLPQAEPVIARFVGLVDAARIWLDGVVQGLLGDDRQL
ncbi:family finger-like domain protein [Roseibacterium elongatum DSM 19469]|uniref:Family finger-like domain protein n=1 Tax=Roseicyclus elongatus DSM 19469 TaxID=1294273 RepID=W8SMT9_9RHOB|nr:hypothetical protein [Roseibacterium elongatum]AHM03845.1 family finger-like domain protein [Roseibacterium elongatum DSM 19469]